VAFDCDAHRLCVLLPQPRAACDVGEQEGDRAAWQGRSDLLWWARQYRCRWHECGTRHAARRRRQPIRRQLGARAADEVVALFRGKLELGRQQGGDLARGPPRIALDLDDQVFRAADQRRQRILGQVERFAAAFDP
jgi:hypothetical protein